MNPWLAFLACLGWLSAAALVALVVLWRRRLRPSRIGSVCVAPELVTHGLLLLDDHGRVLDANRTALGLLGEGHSAVLGRPLPALLPGLDRAALAESGGASTELSLPDGRTLEINSAAVVDAWGRPAGPLLVMRDITARRRVEQDLRRFQFMVENASTECYLAKPDGTLVYVNRAAAEGLGYTVDELMALGMARIDAIVGPGFAQRAEALRQGGALSFETTHVAKDGRRIPKEIRATAVRIGDHDYVCAFGQSIVERKRAEAQRRELDHRTRQNERLESLASLAGEVAHDFNNMLTAVLGNLELALDEMPADVPGRFGITEAMSAGHRAAALARQMLAFAGRGRSHPLPTQLGILLQAVRPRLQALVPEHIQLRVQSDGSVPDVLADAAQVQQGLINLVTNACEAIGGECGVVTVSLWRQDYDESALAACRSGTPPAPGPYAVLEVADTGCGMDAQTVDRVLDPFFTTKVGARGLGLTMVHGIARGLHGAVMVDSALGKGTSVRLLLPVHQEIQVEATVAAPPAPRLPPVPAPAKGLLLIVDDEIPVRVLASRMATRLGFGVLQAVDGVEGVEQFRRHVDEVSCVLLDLTMPRMDGIAAFAALRRIRPDVPIVLCSGYSERDATVHLVDHLLSAFLAKPFTYDAFQAVIGQVMAEGQAMAARP